MTLLVRAIQVAVCAIGVVGVSASAQSTQRGLGGLGKAMQDMASRQIEADQQVEIARRRAEIELELQRRLRLIDTQGWRARSEEEAEERELRARHPQWVRLITSSAFHSWLAAQPPGVQSICKGTRAAEVMSACIDTFLGPTVQASPPSR